MINHISKHISNH